jgi:integrase
MALHRCRRTFASLMIAAGVDAKAPQTYVGDASISITLDHCGRLMPGSAPEPAGLLDTHLAAEQKRSATRVRELACAVDGL